MRIIDRVLSFVWSVLAVAALVAFIVTDDERFVALNMGALALSLLYRIAADLGKRR